MINLSGVCKSFDGNAAVTDVDLALIEGQTTVLIGPSGCGKSTLLRMMVGLVTPDKGTVTQDATALTPDSLPALRRNMGYVIQEGGLFPHLTAKDNILLMSQHLGWADTAQQARLSELCELTHFPRNFLTRYPLELSGGQRQRVALMRALVLDPAILLLDEPLGALDPLIRADLQDDLRAIFQNLGKTVVMVTHDMHEAAFFGDKIVLMQAGSIVQAGPIDELLNTPADPFVTRFIHAQRRILAED
jgi:osmoprotectant transport system ATP-binding protein